MSRLFKFLVVFALGLILGINTALAATCPRCGYNNPDEYKFCIKCGAPLTAVPPVDSSSHSLSGPKKTIAVVGFENSSGLSSYIRMGDDFTSQLTDALIQSGQFTVLSRTELDKVFIEQDLADSGRMAQSLTAQKGKAIPAQILVTGNITEFDEQKSGGSQGITIQGVTLGGSKSNAHIAVIVQIIDSTTGEVLDSQRVEGSANASGFNIGYSGSFNIGSSSFKKTPLGKATQIAIDNAVNYIATKLSKMPWQGRVVTVKDGLVYVNAGSNSGMIPGMIFSVYRPGESLIDPETGINLGSEKTRIAEISISEVQPKFSKAAILNSTQEIQASDMVLEH
ncbi:MAG: zinc-ribbon domain-containing protein [Candidatus Omnitrophica bacterium]|nr:zinc-ribbon domain-containing protein [Candidatus Omnitrophota bacterium]